MTEAEWQECLDTKPLLEHLRISGYQSDRRLRLYACACIREVWELLEDERGKATVVAAEGFADGTVSKVELKRVRKGVRTQCEEMNRARGGVWTEDTDRHTEYCACIAAERAASEKNVSAAIRQIEMTIQYSRLWNRAVALHELLRDIFGNPFHPVTAEPRWLTSTVVALATAIYTERAFDRLPVLADALEEAGCDHPDVLAHCRGPVPHVRGCWVVDLVLGKS